MHRNRDRLRRRDASGFTLLEILIVITILGVLAAVVVLTMSNISNRGRTNACTIEVREINTAIETYRMQDPMHAFPAGPTAADLFDQLEARQIIHAGESTATTSYSPIYDADDHSFAASCPS